MHIRSVSYILDENYQILSIADEFVEFRHINGAPFLPAEVWGQEIWAHIQQNGLAKTFQALFVRARRRPLSLPFRLDTEAKLALWQVEAEAAGGNLLVCFTRLTHKPRPRMAADQVFSRPATPLDYCGWCNRARQPGGQLDWLNFEQAEYLAGLRMISPSAVRVKLCDDCTRGLIHSHEPKYFEHLSLSSLAAIPESVPTMHRQTAPAL